MTTLKEIAQQLNDIDSIREICGELDYLYLDENYEFGDFDESHFIISNGEDPPAGKIPVFHNWMTSENNVVVYVGLESPIKDIESTASKRPYLVVFIDCSDDFIRSYRFKPYNVFSNRISDFSNFSDCTALSRFSALGPESSVEGTFDSSFLVKHHIRKITGTINSDADNFITAETIDVIVNTNGFHLTLQANKITLKNNDNHSNADDSRPVSLITNQLRLRGRHKFIIDSEDVDLILFRRSGEFYKPDSQWKSIYFHINAQSELELLEQFTDHIKLCTPPQLSNYTPKSRTITITEFQSKNLEIVAGRENVFTYSFPVDEFKFINNMNIFVKSIENYEIIVLSQFARSLFASRLDNCENDEIIVPRYFQITDTNIQGLKRPVFDRFYLNPLMVGFNAVSTDFEPELINLIYEYCIGLGIEIIVDNE